MPFQFKQFTIEQSANAHKVGTDSMVLGAWVSGAFKNGLDIGTGTGILALMTAQNQPKATITAIEPNLNACNEAAVNFINSPFSNRLKAIHSRLQDFESADLFDLIICNPPYFVGSTLSNSSPKNKARHTVDLTITDLYYHVSRLLTDSGQFNIVFPSDLINQHFESAKQSGLFPAKILKIENDKGDSIRHLVSFSKIQQLPTESTMIVKYSSGLYSKAYVELTKAFHSKDLPFHG